MLLLTNLAWAKVAKLLIDFGADILAENVKGTKPIDFISGVRPGYLTWENMEKKEILDYINDVLARAPMKGEPK